MKSGIGTVAKHRKVPAAKLVGDYARRELWEALLSWSKQNKAFNRKDMAFIEQLAEGEVYFEASEGKRLNWARDLAAKSESLGFRS